MQRLISLDAARGSILAPPVKTGALAGASLAAAGLSGWWLVPTFGVDGLLWLIIGLAAVAGAIAMFVRPLLGILLLTAVIPLETILVFGDQGGAVTWARVIGLAVFGVWALRKLVTRESWAGLLSAGMVKPAVLLILWAVASFLWAEDASATAEDTWSTIQLVILSLLVIDMADSGRRLEWVVRILMLSGVVVLALTFSQSVLGDVVRAGTGLSGGANQTATYLVVLTPLAFFLLRASSSRLWRAIGVGFAALTPLGVTQTLSRTSFVIMPPVLASQLWEMSRGRKGNRMYILLGGLVIGAILLVAVDWQSLQDRINTISPAIQGVQRADGSVQSSRFHHWLGAIAIFNDFPLAGAGYGNFGYQFLNTYQFEVSPKWTAGVFTGLRSPHSSFLGMLAELGVVGTVLWMWLMVVSLRGAGQKWSDSKRAGNRFQEVLAQAVFYSLLAYGVYGLFTVIHLHKLLWLLFGLTEALRRLAPGDVGLQDDPDRVLAAAASGAPTR